MATPNMNITKPTEGGSSGTWDTILNTAIDVVDAHDHTSGNGARVPSAGLNINAALSMGGSGLTNCGVIGLYSTTSSTACSLFRKSDNELYWRTNGGVDVKVTNGTSLNMTLLGGITGDYTTTDADLEYDDATKAFQFLQDESPDFWAKIKTGDIHLYETASGITNFVTVKSPGSLAASYSLTLPTALPGATSVLTLSSAGQVASTQSPTMVNPTVTGDLTISGDMILPAYATAVVAACGDGATGAVGANGAWTSAGIDYWYIPVQVRVGDRITGVKWNYDRNGNNLQMSLCYSVSGAETVVQTYIDSTSSGAQLYTMTISAGGHTVAGDRHYYAKIQSGAAAQIVYGVQVTHDRP